MCVVRRCYIVTCARRFLQAVERDLSAKKFIQTGPGDVYTACFNAFSPTLFQIVMKMSLPRRSAP